METAEWFLLIIMLQIRTKDINDQNKYKTYNFDNFDLFYIFIKDLTQSGIIKELHIFKNFNWLSDIIINRFKNFYEAFDNTRVSLRTIAKENSLHSCSNFQIKYWIERGWPEDFAKEKVRSIQSKNGQKFAKKLKEGKCNRVTNTQLLWYTRKGYTEEGAKLLLAQRQKTFSKEKCISQYGEKEGTKIFNRRNQKWRKSLEASTTLTQRKLWSSKGADIARNTHYSAESTNTFEYFYKKYKDQFTCFLEPFTKEFSLKKEDNTQFFYDFTIKELNLIFEYNGEHVHANPDWPKEKLDTWKNIFNPGQTASQNIEYFNKKIQLANKAGFQVVILWSSHSIDFNQKIISDVILKTLQKL